MDNIWKAIKALAKRIWDSTKKYAERIWNRFLIWHFDFSEEAIKLVKKVFQLGADVVCECVLFFQEIKDGYVEVTSNILYLDNNNDVKGIPVGQPQKIPIDQVPPDVLKRLQNSGSISEKEVRTLTTAH